MVTTPAPASINAAAAAVTALLRCPVGLVGRVNLINVITRNLSTGVVRLLWWTVRCPG
ncbi:hypothetical protein GCM10010341_24340 [Streptomyces noursei]|nr:hypothetical protein GCM10010341_24340 [Streptomyces noursei]